jgi:bifunctional DNase/RNase
MDKIKLNIIGISSSQTQAGAYALILAEADGKRRLPIIIGGFEAQAIAIELEKMKPPRPLTHDLFISFSHAHNIDIKEVLINKFSEGIFFAELITWDGKTQKQIDARTSDAVALSLRFKCPIYTTPEVMNEAGIVMEDLVPEDEENFPPQQKSSEQPLSNKTSRELEKMLKEAVSTENYEMASRIRDELKKRRKEK